MKLLIAERYTLSKTCYSKMWKVFSLQGGPSQRSNETKRKERNEEDKFDLTRKG